MITTSSESTTPFKQTTNLAKNTCPRRGTAREVKRPTGEAIVFSEVTRNKKSGAERAARRGVRSGDQGREVATGPLWLLSLQYSNYDGGHLMSWRVSAITVMSSSNCADGAQ